MRLKNSNAGLYFNTLKYMKWSQVYYRIRKMAGLECGIGAAAHADVESVNLIKPVQELDFDPVFLSRFQVSELMSDHISFLHSEAVLDWNGEWNFRDKSPLWNYNLHYFEYLFPLLNEYEKEKESFYLQKAVLMIRSWISNNPCKKGGPGWAPYTINLRLTNWLSFYSLAESDLTEECRMLMRKSIAEQYIFLSRHVEKDILGNHYLEDLKTLVLCAVYFKDWRMLDTAYSALLKECNEEILEDGMHYELSPMYHNIILEDLIKIYVALKGIDYPADELKKYIQIMLDAAWSLGESVNRLPLFNDCGNNVAKSLSSLVAAAESHLFIKPIYKSVFSKAGFYIFKRGEWKLIVDAGQPGPAYIPGHAHCDALSFELYRNGEPIITNCGTYAYQSDLRSQFRNTASHNTVMINGVEQSQCWGAFRMAKRSSIRVLDADENYLRAEIKDYCGQKCMRTIHFSKELIVTDLSDSNTVTGFIHLLEEIPVKYSCEKKKTIKHLYAPDYGRYSKIDAIAYSGKSRIKITVKLD